ncbi:MAG: hypothetical protein OXC62_11435 [Aestuariivita sp.]|nr:hypothetical protein [Aestuariivita sp.]
MDGTGGDVSVYIAPDNYDKAAKFVKELMNGDNVVIRNNDERNLADFSLNGSFAAIINWRECWDAINTSSNDPFLNSNDPFN